mgnify:CR=1 FL=1
MDKDRLNNMVVDLFHGISYEEEKAVITDEFKDISNKDLHIIDAIGIKKPKNIIAVLPTRFKTKTKFCLV